MRSLLEKKMKNVELTVRNFSDQVGDKERSANIGELIANQFQVSGDSHHGGIL
jgi:hypothetical protein